MFRHMYIVVFNTYINSIMTSAQPYHDTSAVHLLVMWYIPTNDDSVYLVNYHPILPSTFPTFDNDTTEMSVTKKSIIQ